MDAAREFLRLLGDRRPPPLGKHHALMLQDDARSGLDLLIWTGDEGHVVHLDEEDFQRDLSEVVTGAQQCEHAVHVGIGE